MKVLFKEPTVQSLDLNDFVLSIVASQHLYNWVLMHLNGELAPARQSAWPQIAAKTYWDFPESLPRLTLKLQQKLKVTVTDGASQTTYLRKCTEF